MKLKFNYRQLIERGAEMNLVSLRAPILIEEKRTIIAYPSGSGIQYTSYCWDILLGAYIKPTWELILTSFYE